VATVHRDPRGKSPYWYAYFTDANGKRRCMSTKETDKEKAKLKCAQWNDEALLLRNATTKDAQAVKVMNRILETAGSSKVKVKTIKGWCEEWIAESKETKAEGSALRYETVLTRFETVMADDASRPLAFLQADHILAFRRSEQKEGRSPRTCNFSIKVISAALTRAVKRGYILRNPCMSIEPLAVDVEETQPFSTTQIESLLAIADSEWEGAILLGCRAGMSIGDATRLIWKSISLKNSTLIHERAKTGERVEITLKGNLKDYFVQLTKTPHAGNLVFPTLAKTHISRLGKIFSQLMKKAGIERPVIAEKTGNKGRIRYGLGFHSLRHNFVYELTKAGVPMDIRKKMAGHSSDKSHQVYTHTEITSISKAQAKLPKLNQNTQ
jgi:integrase